MCEDGCNRCHWFSLTKHRLKSIKSIFDIDLFKKKKTWERRHILSSRWQQWFCQLSFSEQISFSSGFIQTEAEIRCYGYCEYINASNLWSSRCVLYRISRQNSWVYLQILWRFLCISYFQVAARYLQIISSHYQVLYLPSRLIAIAKKWINHPVSESHWFVLKESVVCTLTCCFEVHRAIQIRTSSLFIVDIL